MKEYKDHILLVLLVGLIFAVIFALMPDSKILHLKKQRSEMSIVQ